MNVPLALLFVVPAALILSAAPTQDPDTRLAASVMSTYNFKTYLKGDAITVQCREGIATLTGTVQDDFHRTLAAETAADLTGIRGVNNRLALKGGQPEEGSDAWITARVKTALLFHHRVNGYGTDVATQDGVVTLKGMAASPADKDLVAECAGDIMGVKALDNQMSIASAADPKPSPSFGEEIDDASVTAQIKTTLQCHRSTHLIAAKVKTDQGAVTLSGAVPTAIEKERISRLVNGITGVKTLTNRMIVAKPVS
jgi:osmotically-inducible protein OsmY